MATNKIDNFNERAEIIFRPFLENYGYTLKTVKINYLDGKKWSIHHLYLNNNAKLRIELHQEPYYTDYGFSFFLYRIGTDDYNILYNVPHEKQDKEDEFLNKVCDNLLSNPEIIDLISGRTWKKLKQIPYRT